VIRVSNVSKRFRVYRQPADRLKEIVLRRRLHHEAVALQDVSFEVAPGEAFGIIGRNGAGKSTLLKLVMGISLPDAGSVHVDGRITGLLELGTGFNPELSGDANIGFNAALLGMTPAEVARKRDEIIAFSELEEFIDRPLKTYSSGMVVRLAFAIAVHAEPACLVVDEALAVGDAHFQQKCMRRIADFRAQGGAIVLVSHDLNAIKVVCNRAMVLDRGRVVTTASPDDAVNVYNQIIAGMEEGDLASAGGQRRAAGIGYGTRELEFVGARLVGSRSGGRVVGSGEVADLVLRIRANAELAEDATLGIMIRNRLGQDVFGTNTHLLGRGLRFKAGTTSDVVLRMPMNLGPGMYTVTAALHSEETHLHQCYHWCDGLTDFEVAGFLGPRFYGVCRLEPELILDEAAVSAPAQGCGTTCDVP